MLDKLTEFVALAGLWSYVVLFLASLLESAPILALLIPGSALVLIAGFLSDQGPLDLGTLFVVVTAGSIVGEMIGYEMGKRLGHPWLVLHGHRAGITEERLGQAERFFEQHGGKAVLFGRFIGFLRALIPFVAGSARMRYRAFLAYDACGALVWSVVFLLLGHFLGRSWHLAQVWMGRATAIGAGILLLVLALVFAWRYLVHHESGVRQAWRKFRKSPRVVRMRRRLAPQLLWLQNRLTPQGFLGLELTVGSLFIICMAWLFGLIAESVLTDDPLTRLDHQVHAWFRAHSAESLTTLFEHISWAHGLGFTGLLTLVLAVLLARKRRWQDLLALAVAIPGIMAVNAVAKQVFRRERPPLQPDFDLTTFSFPSGHVSASTVFYGFLAFLVIRRLSAWKWRVLAVLSATFLVLLVGLSRVYLGYHYLSDALAATAEGLAWLALCLTAVGAMGRRDRGANGRTGGIQSAKPSPPPFGGTTY